MEDFIGDVIAFTLKNFTLTFLAIGVVVAVVVIAVKRPAKHGVYATLLNWFLFFAIGVTYTFNGIMHVAFGEMSAESIGWEDSPFQAEVGFASIGIGIIGFMGFAKRAPFSLKFAALVGPACFLWGAAGTHIADIIATGNMSPNNAGVILYTDILIPVIGLVLWALAVSTSERTLSTEAESQPGAAEASAEDGVAVSESR